MKKILAGLVIGLFILSMAGMANATFVDLDGNYYIQRGSVYNTYTSNLVSFEYSLGTPDVNIATWDSNGGSYLGGGTASDYLSNPNYFQTVTWSGLNVGTGVTWSFLGLDIDLITSISPLSVTGQTIDNGSLNSLRNGYLTAYYADGSSASASLIGNAGWRGAHDYDLIADGAPIPEPGTLLLLGTGFAGFIGLRKKFKI